MQITCACAFACACARARACACACAAVNLFKATCLPFDTQEETLWDVYTTGGTHPALVCAAVYAERDEWAAAARVAAGILEHVYQPLTRIEALRLLGRCEAQAADNVTAVLGSLERAAAEARRAGYLWLELMVARDCVVYAGASRRRLANPITAVRATPQEVTPFLSALGGHRTFFADHELDAMVIVEEAG